MSKHPSDDVPVDAGVPATTETRRVRVVRCDAHRPGTMLNPMSFLEVAGGFPEVFIEFHDQLYRLSRTRSGKLILTKALGEAID